MLCSGRCPPTHTRSEKAPLFPLASRSLPPPDCKRGGEVYHVMRRPPLASRSLPPPRKRGGEFLTNSTRISRLGFPLQVEGSPLQLQKRGEFYHAQHPHEPRLISNFVSYDFVVCCLLLLSSLFSGGAEASKRARGGILILR